MTREELILRPDGVRAAGADTVVDVRLPWYRSLPLNAVTAIDVSVDGEAIDQTRLTVEVAGGVHAIPELAEHFETVWFIQDPGVVRVAGLALEPGEEHEVTVGVGLRLPYIIIEGIGPLQRYNEITRTVVVQEGTDR